jgi:hypothetical protein
MHDREQSWRSADGRQIKIKDMDIGHLVNVINWVIDNKNSYPDSIRDLMVAEAQYRQLTLFAEGKAYPQRIDNRWVLIDPVTGKKGIIPPPKEYLDNVKNNVAYQEMSKNTQIKRTRRVRLA